jgi:lipopolysaccharide export LptBFGC system permease protein LptF
MPAVVLGLTVALVSLLFLCFIVPVFTLKVEQVIYSNLAQLIANQIERSHQIKFDKTTIFAQEATVDEPDPAYPNEQRVTLGGLMIVALEKEEAVEKKKEERLNIPREFYLARRAIVFIRPTKTGDEFSLEAKLEGGAMFPRKFSAKETTTGGLVATEYGPIPITSLIKEDTKFMDIRRLQELNQDLTQSRRVQEQLSKIVQQQQEAAFLTEMHETLSRPGGTKELTAGTEKYDVSAAPGGQVTLANGKLQVAPAKFIEYRNGELYRTADVGQLELSAEALTDDQLNIQAQLRNVVSTTREGRNDRASFLRSFVVPAPVKSSQLERDLDTYLRPNHKIGDSDRMALQREWFKIRNAIHSEMHARASFAVSCLILVVVGCFLGMMFKSGNFLSAFALSVMPALLCIALIVAGQHTACNIPYKIETDFKDPLSLGIGLIWSGNVVALALAIVFGVRMQKQ